MSEEQNLDIDDLRQSRIARLEATLVELEGRLTHHGWPITEAEVTDCRPGPRSRAYYARPTAGPLSLLIGYVVSFRYSVDGKTYTGCLNSPVEVEPQDQFKLRYNPDHPEENNSAASKNSPSSILSPVIAAILAALFIALFIKEHFFRY